MNDVSIAAILPPTYKTASADKTLPLLTAWTVKNEQFFNFDLLD